MKSRLTPHFQDLVYDATLKSFWRKKSLRKFLLNCGVSDKFLAGWASEESKRELLDRLFEHLPNTDNGRVCLVRMANSLIEQQSFPDLMNWEDSKQKLKDARDAIDRLRVYCAQQEEQIESATRARKAREEFEKRQQESIRSRQSLDKLSARLTVLAGQMGSQEAGYAFQDWFYDLMDFCELQSRKPYVHNGRQIDGSVTLGDTTYLVELKFTGGPADAREVDVFRRKVTSKADNTMGIMLSMSGFSSVAKEAASGERTPVLLLDHSHLYLVVEGAMSMAEVIERVRRHASQTGEAFLATEHFSM